MSDACTSRESRVRIVALGNPDAGDDAAALHAARGAALALPACVVVEAGRPGVALLDLLDGPAPVVLVDVVRSGAPPGTLHLLPIEDILVRGRARPRASSHDLGPAEAIRLAAALGRPLPRGRFVGVEGADFTVGAPLSAPVARALPAMTTAVIDALRALAEDPAPTVDASHVQERS
jgi:hydrogenase maturation protease